VLAALLLLAAAPAGAEPPAAAAAPASAPAAGLDFRHYLARVLAANPELAAARAGVDVARAQIPIAKVFPDPQLTLGLTQLEVTRQGNPTVLGAQLSLPIELGGKRSRRIAVAQAGLHAAGLDFKGAVRDLRAAAANAFIDALYARLVVAQKERALAHLERLVHTNERRFKAGDIAEAAVLQSRVEARQFRADVLAARGEQLAAEIAAARLLGPDAGATPPALGGDLRLPPTGIEAARLLATVESRPDVRAAAARVETARRQVALEQAKRVVDVSVGAGWQHNFPVGGPGGVKGADFLVGSLSVPLPFSHVYKGELQAAHAAQRQAQSQLEAARVRAASELKQALARFDAAARRVAIYDSGILADSETVLEKTLYSYQRGSATLVEVLIAQRTASDVHLAYLDALAARARAVAAVEQAAGGETELLRF
jgi:cobalt-zinc-cadmium efflux system outer membrane protein